MLVLGVCCSGGERGESSLQCTSKAQRGKARDGRIQSTCLVPRDGTTTLYWSELSQCQMWVQDYRAGTVLVALPTQAGSKDQLASVFRSINLYLYFAQLKVSRIDY